MDSSKRITLGGKYRLLEKIQQGGMSTVYRARNDETDELVAVKYFDTTRHLPAIQLEAFQREVEALRNLEHPNIVRLFDSGQDEQGKSFLVLELMKHDLLAEKIAKGQPFEGWDDFAALIALPLLHALSRAHEVGIAHRDIKPGNILVSDEGVVKLADFGISKLKKWLAPRLTLNDFMSPPFSPPEPDDGNYTYSRDVFSVGVLCLWALSERPIVEYKDIAEALASFNVPPEVKAIISKAVAPIPAARPQSAALLAAELARVQANRRQAWADRERKRCAISMTNRALEIAREEVPLQSDDAIRAFLAHDINSESAVQRFMEKAGAMTEKPRAGHYIILGSSLRYHIALNNKGFDNFSVLGIFRPDLHFLQRDRGGSCPCPLTFDFVSRVGIVSHNEAAALLERTLEAFEDARHEDERRARETALFDAWLRVLDAKVQFERERSRPVEFTSCAVADSQLFLQTESDLEGIELGEARFIEVDDGSRIRGEVWEVKPGELVLNCPSADLKDVPQHGIAKLDLYALQVAVDRQRDAINRVRNATSVKGRLKEMLLNPGSVHPPTTTDALSPDLELVLDTPQRDALKATLASNDVFLVQGPPGTGKTQFITGLIAETLRKSPKARILLTSQTHVAIDNALHRLGDKAPTSRILRIAREQSNRVATSAEPYLVSNQMHAWRAQVHRTAREGLGKWASRQGIDPTDMLIGSLAKQIAELRVRIEEVRLRISSEDERKQGLERMKEGLSQPTFEIELEQVKDELQNLREELDAHKKQLHSLEKELEQSREDAAALITMTPAEQAEWADVLIGNEPQRQVAERIMKLQGEWLNRFGTSDAFIGPLVEISSVVASTCVGLAAIDSIDDVAFDLCIIDEASKATAMESCVPMVRARKWVLVGDSKQLPPFREEILARPELRERFGIESAEAEESIFERLGRLLPDQNKAMLTIQYRMVEPIGRLISNCFYQGALISRRTEIDPVVCGVTGFAVNWMSTRELARREDQTAGTSFVNPEEASQICDLLVDLEGHLADSGREGTRTVLLLSAYGAQVNHLERRLRNIRHELRHLNVECCTVDQVQGREADIVFFSVTRSNAASKAGFLRALERINVALSRARDLLMIVGDDHFVQRAEHAEPLRRVLQHIQKWRSECYVGVLENRLRTGR